MRRKCLKKLAAMISCAFLISGILASSATGFINLDKNVISTVYAADGRWVKSADGRWWYRHADGGFTKNGWEEVTGKWYYFDGDGWMKTGWQKINGKWYYLGESNDGSMKSGWQNINGKWYYLGEPNDGAMKSGWQKINGEWYYLGEPNDGSMKTGWLVLEDATYYLLDSGAMAVGDLSIDGNVYKFNSDGRLSDNNDDHFNYREIAPKGYIAVRDGEDMVRFVKRYKGIDTTDEILYDKKHKEYIEYGNEIKEEELKELDLKTIFSNQAQLLLQMDDESYSDFRTVIMKIDGKLTCVLIADIDMEEDYKTEAYDLLTKKDVTDRIVK